MPGLLNVLETVPRRQSGENRSARKEILGIWMQAGPGKGWSLACYMRSMVCRSPLPLSVPFLVPRQHLPQEYRIFLSFISTISPYKPPYTTFVFPPTSLLPSVHVLEVLCDLTWPWQKVCVCPFSFLPSTFAFYGWSENSFVSKIFLMTLVQNE